MVARGEIWLLEEPDHGPRPVLVLTRNKAIPRLNRVVVTPITSTIRYDDTFLPLGREQGLDHDSVATFDNLMAVPKYLLTARLGGLGSSETWRMCDPLLAMADCA